MKIAFLAMTSLVAVISATCMGGGPIDVSEADDRFVANDLPGASAVLSTLQGEHPDSPEVMLRVALDQVLAGEWDAADATLADLEAKTGDESGEIRFRRAMVAVQAGDNDRLDDIKTHGLASGLPKGKLFAAEVHLVDAEADDALELLKEVRGEPGAVGQTAEAYLALLESGSVYKSGLAEAGALWSVGLRDVAVPTAEEMLKQLDDAEPMKAEQMLVWAGRAVTSGNPGAAATLLAEIAVIGAPENQNWRVQATRAMVFVADGQTAEAVAILDSLQEAAADGFVPYEGLMDARATAAALSTTPADARLLAGDVESVEAARGLFRAGATRVARDAAPSSSAFATFLENR